MSGADQITLLQHFSTVEEKKKKSRFIVNLFIWLLLKSQKAQELLLGLQISRLPAWFSW